MFAFSSRPLSAYPLLLRIFFWKQRKTYGKVLEPSLLWGRSPWLFSTLALLYGALDRRSSPLSPALRSLITVRVSQINHCAFCVDVNSATLQKRGVSLERVAALTNWHDSELFDARERLALEYAESMTVTAPGVSDELRERVLAHFGEDALVELTGLVAFQNLSSKFNAALDVPSQGFCVVPSDTV